MATIELRLSSKVNKDNGKTEVLVRYFNGKQFNLRAKTEVYINPRFFEYYINTKATKALGVTIPDKVTTATLEEAVKKDYVLRDSGEIVIKQRIETPEVKYHRGQAKKIHDIKEAINDAYENADKDAIEGDWLKVVIDKFNHPEKYVVKEEKPKATFFELAAEYLEKKKFSEGFNRGFQVILRDLARYEGFIQETDKQRPDFTLDVDTLTRDDFEDIVDYLKNEKALSKEYPLLFKRLLKVHPVGCKAKGQQELKDRGDNTIIKLTKRFKAFLVWCYESGKTTNRPFDGVKIGTEVFGTPYYITIDERNQIAAHDFSHSKHLETQRDIFIFQCLTGCRVGDLRSLTWDNVINGVLVYAPHKTKDEGKETLQARVPLHEKAVAIIEKYKGTDKRGRLLPCISPQKYNDAIKVIFTQAGITRNVVIRNATTGENETRPINEIASSHLARRTFIGNAYLKVSDPNIIGKMSGHAEGSKAFSRYRNIEDETLQEVIDQIG